MRTVRVAGWVAMVLLATCLGCSSKTPGAASPASPPGPPSPAPTTPAQAPPLPSPSAPGAGGRPTTLAAVTTQGTVELLDPATGAAVRTLATGATGAIGDEVAVSPDGSNVYYMTGTGCQGQVRVVPAAGGVSSVVASGSYPALNPAGTELAYVREPRDVASCPQGSFTFSNFAVVIRTLATGSEQVLAQFADPGSQPLPEPIDHIGWSADGASLAVDIGAGQDNEQWNTFIVHPGTDHTYAQPPQAAGLPARFSYYREAVPAGPGQLFVNTVCCAGIQGKVTSTVLALVPVAGGAGQQVAVGFTDRDHSSLDVHQPGGRWLLYLSGTDLYVSDGGGPVAALAHNLLAAAW